MPPKKRDRPRVKGSWRDKGKGECFTRTNKSGGTYKVCNDPPRGSSGQKGVYKAKPKKPKKLTEAQKKKRKEKEDKRDAEIKELKKKLKKLQTS